MTHGRTVRRFLMDGWMEEGKKNLVRRKSCLGNWKVKFCSIVISMILKKP